MGRQVQTKEIAACAHPGRDVPLRSAALQNQDRRNQRSLATRGNRNVRQLGGAKGGAYREYLLVVIAGHRSVFDR